MAESLVKLHEYQELLSCVVELLNDEWPRSETARLRSLTDSRDDLPCCLLLIKQGSQKKIEVIGQSKLTKIHGRLSSVYIENVVVDKAKRGLGYGRKLMALSEGYAQNLGYQTIYLSTHEKCKFYEHLGYQYSQPVTPIRENAKILTPEQFSALHSHFGEKVNEDMQPLPKSEEETEDAGNYKENESRNSLKPRHDIHGLHKTTETGGQLNVHNIEMQIMNDNTRQCLSPNMAIPIPPIPPPPPPPPSTPPSCIQSSPSTASNKLGNKHLIWMVKTLL